MHKSAAICPKPSSPQPSSPYAFQTPPHDSLVRTGLRDFEGFELGVAGWFRVLGLEPFEWGLQKVRGLPGFPSWEEPGCWMTGYRVV